MGMKSRKRVEPGLRLTKALTAYQAARVRSHAIWELWEGQPNDPAAVSDVTLVEEKFGRPLPADYKQFLLLHDGWEGYEYDLRLLSASEILDGPPESLEINMDNVSEDEADMLDKVFVVGVSNNDASILYFDPTTDGEPTLVEYYCEELGRHNTFTEFIEGLAAGLHRGVDAELATQQQACADWDPVVRQEKNNAYQAQLAERLQAASAAAPSSELSDVERAAIDACAQSAGKQPSLPTELKSGLQVHLGLVAYMLYVPTADEVTAVATLFRKHFPWDKRTKACAPSDEYAAKVISPDTSDYSEFLTLQSGGHFGLRLADDSGRNKTTHIFNFRGVPSYHGEAVATFLEIMVPADANPAALRALMLDLAEAVPFIHGLAGYMVLPTNADYTRHMKQFYQWSRVHWALQVALADELVGAALHGLHGVSWLTLIDNPTVDTLHKGKRALPADGVEVHKRQHATVLQAGDSPSLGDIRVAYPHAYAAVHQALAPLVSPGIAELRHFDDHGATQAWWKRFERPGVFAETPTELCKRIEAAAKVGDTATMRSLWQELESREPAARITVQTPLSKLGLALLRENNTAIAFVIYDWLTQFERPGLHDLNNALSSVWTTPEHVPMMIERAMPYAEANPSIFHNVIALYCVHGELDKAIEIATQSEPHYELDLFRQVSSNKDFAPLLERPEFVAIHQRIGARLEPSSDWAPLARNEALEVNVGRRPDDEAAYREYSEWLTSQGDPRGALIAAHIDTATQPRSKPHRKAFKKLFKAYVKNRLAGTFPRLAKHFSPDSSPPWGFELRWGVVYNVAMTQLPKDCLADALAFLQDPECLFLRSLYLRDRTWDLGCLESVPYLTRLSLQRATFSGLEPVAKLEQLDELILNQTDVADLSALAGMRSLRKLYLKSTKVVDLTPVATLANLEFIQLEASGVTNIEPLFALPRLKEVWLYKTTVTQADAEKLEHIIKDRRDGVSVYGP